LYSTLDEDIQKCVYFDELNKELKFPINNTNYSLDFCILKDNKKFCLEYFGTYWHASPDTYNWDSIILEDTLACDVWQHDFERKSYLEKCGFKCEIVWEHDVIDDKLKELHNSITEYFR
jgi:G:T-mismatch repair DNA endonuclease (very short patch repair protein)